MLKIASDDTCHRNIFCRSRNAGFQTADSADYQIDHDAGIRRSNKSINDINIGQTVHFHANIRFIATFRHILFIFYFFKKRFFESRRGNKQSSVIVMEHTIFKAVKKSDRVSADLRVRRENSEIRILP